jgi:GTPase SAR1 family protein
LTHPSRVLGKSSVTIQFVEEYFADTYSPTIENTFNKSLKYKGREYSLSIVDTAGLVRSNGCFVASLLLAANAR